MKQNNLLVLLNSLSAKEKKWLLQFTNSPFYNRNEEVTIFLEALLKKRRSEEVDFTLIFFEGLFQKKKWSTQKVYDLISFAHRLVEFFLVQLNFREEEALQQKMLLRELRQRGLIRSFEKTKNKIEIARKKDCYTNDEYYHQQYLISEEIDVFLVQNEPREAYESLQEKADSLDSFYLISKLKTACEMLNRANIVQADYQLNLVGEVNDYLERNVYLFKTVPATEVYYVIFKTLTVFEDETYFYQLLKLIKNHLPLFPKEEGKGLYHYAQNYCIKQINKGNSAYLKEIFGLYQEQIANDYILQHNQITEWDYKNIITVGLRLKEYEWTENFIHRYKVKLSESTRENAYNYNLSNFYYEKGAFKQSIRLLQSVRFTDTFYNLSARFLLIKIFYEQEESEALLDQARALKAFLSRNKSVSDSQKNGYKNLTKYTVKLNTIRDTMPKKKTITFLNRVDSIQLDIENNNQVTNKNWLLEKVVELR